MRIHDYSNIINSSILLKENKIDLSLKENKIDLSLKEIKLLNNNYLDQFYDFINSSKSGRI